MEPGSEKNKRVDLWHGGSSQFSDHFVIIIIVKHFIIIINEIIALIDKINVWNEDDVWSGVRVK